jgi:hypothetical protein
MLGNCLIRNPTTREKKLDVGAVCESLLFFSRTHVVLDQGTLSLFVNSGFLDDVIEMLKQGYITASYSPELPALYTSNNAGLREHHFVVIRVGGNQETGQLKRSADALLFHLESLLKDKVKAKRYHRELCKLLSFKDLEKDPVETKALEDLKDPAFASEIARMSLLNFGVPSSEIKPFRVTIMPLGNGKFAIATDIDFQRLRKYIPSEPEFDQNLLFPGVGDARLDIFLAAKHNAAFIGNDANQRVVELILNKAIGVRADGDGVVRAVYDFISIDTPSVREVINSGSRTPKEFMALLGKAAGFRKWLNEQNPDKDLIQELLREKTKDGWLESLPVKAVRFGIFTGGGLIANMIAPGTGLAFGLADKFLIDKLAKQWRPHFFVENQLRGFLDAGRKE